MKNAICFYGYFSTNKMKYENISEIILKNNTKIPENFDKNVTIRHFKKFIIENNNIDIFFHSWNTDKESQDLLIKEYEPKKYLFEQQKNITNLPNNPVDSRFYSEYMSTKLMIDYQKENNIEYNLVMHTLFDNLFFVNIDFSKLNNKFIYNSNWNSARPFKKNNIYYETGDGLYEQWYIANPDNIKLITDYKSHSSIYRKYGKNNPLNNKQNSHFYRLLLIKELKLLDKLKFILYVGKEKGELNQIQVPWYNHLIKKCLLEKH